VFCFYFKCVELENYQLGAFEFSFVYTNGLLQPVELVFKSCLTALPPIDSDPKERETQREI